MKPGPHFKEVLESVANLQLDGVIGTKEEALEWVQKNR